MAFCLWLKPSQENTRLEMTNMHWNISLHLTYQHWGLTLKDSQRQLQVVSSWVAQSRNSYVSSRQRGWTEPSSWTAPPVLVRPDPSWATQHKMQKDSKIKIKVISRSRFFAQEQYNSRWNHNHNQPLLQPKMRNYTEIMKHSWTRSELVSNLE